MLNIKICVCWKPEPWQEYLLLSAACCSERFYVIILKLWEIFVYILLVWEICVYTYLLLLGEINRNLKLMFFFQCLVISHWNLLLLHLGLCFLSLCLCYCYCLYLCLFLCLCLCLCRKEENSPLQNLVHSPLLPPKNNICTKYHFLKWQNNLVQIFSGIYNIILIVWKKIKQ